MKIDESDEQYENADSAIDESWEPDSNVTIERELHPEKQYSGRDESWEPDSNVTIERDVHS
jgi:hypothetical protein